MNSVHHRKYYPKSRDADAILSVAYGAKATRCSGLCARLGNRASLISAVVGVFMNLPRLFREDINHGKRNYVEKPTARPGCPDHNFS